LRPGAQHGRFQAESGHWSCVGRLYSQRLRDQHLGWTPDYPRTSVHFDERARAVRVTGLARMMQLSVACALPPYNVLSGAWLVALAPFTALGRRRSRARQVSASLTRI
jgi:hypothetical protein